MKRPILSQIGGGLVRAGLILIAAFGLRLAGQAGWFGEDGGRRIIQILIGLTLAIYANGMPKQMGSTPRPLKAQGYAQTALRVGGWSMTLAGLVYAGLWAFAPVAVADIASKAVVATATLITLGYTAWVILSCRADDRRQSLPRH
jgi:hypothetical protein